MHVTKEILRKICECLAEQGIHFEMSIPRHKKDRLSYACLVKNTYPENFGGDLVGTGGWGFCPPRESADEVMKHFVDSRKTITLKIY
jgi:hypothetical protein